MAEKNERKLEGLLMMIAFVGGITAVRYGDFRLGAWLHGAREVATGKPGILRQGKFTYGLFEHLSHAKDQDDVEAYLGPGLIVNGNKMIGFTEAWGSENLGYTIGASFGPAGQLYKFIGRAGSTCFTYEVELLASCQ